jgi:hypothetical protein
MISESRLSPMERLSRVKVAAEPEISIIRDEPEEDLKNTFSVREESRMIIEEKVPPKIQRSTAFMQKDKELSDEDDDDELEIPAFIRRKMGK